MNPFDLPGPTFLVFYWTVSIVGALFLYWLRLRSDVPGAPAQLPSDPYLLAYLRDGHPELVRVALLVLVEEGPVIVEGRNFALAPKPPQRARRSGRPAIEEELLDFLRQRPASIDDIVDAAVGLDLCEGYRRSLEDLGLLRRPARIRGLRSAAGGVTALLLGLAVIKLLVAFSRGRSNVLFLIASAVAAVWIVYEIGRLRVLVTTRGEQALESVAALLAGARRRLQQARAALEGRELAWLAAAFGFSVFNTTEADFAFWPALAFESGTRYLPPHERYAIPKPPWFSSSSCGGGGSSCGGGGGGGGCGGGCGGCGS